MALLGLETYYSFPNNTKNNFRYSRGEGKDEKWHNINVPKGCYEISNVKDHIHKILKERRAEENSILIELNNNTLMSVLNVAAVYKVDFIAATYLKTVLGVSDKI